jgi:hypothetical protein
VDLYLNAELLPYPGLPNSGAYCFVTTALQLLFHIPAVRDCVLNFPCTDPPPAFIALKSLFAALLHGETEFPPDEFARQMGVHKGEQCDVSEFLERCLGLLEPLFPTFSQLYASELFEPNREPHRLLGVPVSAVDDGITHDNLADFATGLHLDMNPPIQFFLLNRADSKDDRDASFSYKTDLQLNGDRYQLFGVVVHKGTLNQGHFQLFARPYLGQWVSFSDADTHYVLPRDALDANFGRDSPAPFRRSPSEQCPGASPTVAYVLAYFRESALAQVLAGPRLEPFATAIPLPGYCRGPAVLAQRTIEITRRSCRGVSLGRIEPTETTSVAQGITVPDFLEHVRAFCGLGERPFALFPCGSRGRESLCILPGDGGSAVASAHFFLDDTQAPSAGLRLAFVFRFVLDDPGNPAYMGPVTFVDQAGLVMGIRAYIGKELFDMGIDRDGRYEFPAKGKFWGALPGNAPRIVTQSLIEPADRAVELDFSRPGPGFVSTASVLKYAGWHMRLYWFMQTRIEISVTRLGTDRCVKVALPLSALAAAAAALLARELGIAAEPPPDFVGGFFASSWPGFPALRGEWARPRVTLEQLRIPAKCFFVFVRGGGRDERDFRVTYSENARQIARVCHVWGPEKATIRTVLEIAGVAFDERVHRIVLVMNSKIYKLAAPEETIPATHQDEIRVEVVPEDQRERRLVKVLYGHLDGTGKIHECAVPFYFPVIPEEGPEDARERLTEMIWLPEAAGNLQFVWYKTGEKEGDVDFADRDKLFDDPYHICVLVQQPPP